MNNIWKYSLVLSFTVIADQLIKGTAQSLIPTLGGFSVLFSEVYLTRLANPFFIFGIDLGLSSSWSNEISEYLNLLLCFPAIWWIVKWRNRAPHKGWCLTLILTALFSSWLDRNLHGHTLDYLSITKNFSFSIADLYLFIGLMGLTFFTLKERSKG
ncbi:MAG: hypothetical protein CME60_06305 [Halobacteriovoraceae bacterium]|nr:hypothetical protein [Halobacteriovoraceae bacterium]